MNSPLRSLRPSVENLFLIFEQERADEAEKSPDNKAFSLFVSFVCFCQKMYLIFVTDRSPITVHRSPWPSSTANYAASFGRVGECCWPSPHDRRGRDVLHLHEVGVSESVQRAGALLRPVRGWPTSGSKSRKLPLAELDRLAKLPGVSRDSAADPVLCHGRPGARGGAAQRHGVCRCPTSASRSSTTSCCNAAATLPIAAQRSDRQRRLRPAARLHPGQRIHLILNNRRQELFVVGTAISSEFVYLVGPGSIAPDPEHFGVFYLKRTSPKRCSTSAGPANQIVGLSGPGHRARAGRDSAQHRSRCCAPYGVCRPPTPRNQASNQFLSDEIRGLGVFSTIMPAIFLAVAALVLNVLMVAADRSAAHDDRHAQSDGLQRRADLSPLRTLSESSRTAAPVGRAAGWVP